MNNNDENKHTYKSAEKTKELNDAALKPAVSYYNSSILRDQNFELNRKRMEKANKTLKRSYRIGLILELVILFYSVVLFWQHIVTAMYSVMSLGREYKFVSSGWVFVTPFAILGVIMTILANKYMDNKFTVWLYVSYAAFGIIGILSFFSVWDDMNFMKGINIVFGSILCIESLVGIILCNHTYDAVKEVESLVNEEGFPTFNAAMFYMHSSKYVKYRERWEEKHKTLDDYAKNDRKSDDTAAASDKMDGVEVKSSDIEKDFDEMKSVTVNNSENKMDEVFANSDDDYTYQTNDPKKKYL